MRVMPPSSVTTDDDLAFPRSTSREFLFCNRFVLPEHPRPNLVRHADQPPWQGELVEHGQRIECHCMEGKGRASVVGPSLLPARSLLVGVRLAFSVPTVALSGRAAASLHEWLQH